MAPIIKKTNEKMHFYLDTHNKKIESCSRLQYTKYSWTINYEIIIIKSGDKTSEAPCLGKQEHNDSRQAWTAKYIKTDPYSQHCLKITVNLLDIYKVPAIA